MAFFNRIFGGSKKKEVPSTTNSQLDNLPIVWYKHFEIMPENCKFRKDFTHNEIKT